MSNKAIFIKPNKMPTHVTIMVAICSLLCTSVYPYTSINYFATGSDGPPNDKPVIFTATLNTSVHTSTSNFLDDISAAIYTKKDRIKVESETYSDNGKVCTVVFHFIDPTASDDKHSRKQLEKWLLAMVRSEVYVGMKLLELVSDTIQDQRPTGWEFKLNTPPYFTNYGLLYLRPNSSVPWGTVCKNGFTDTDAPLAACHSLGYDNISTASIGKYDEVDKQYESPDNAPYYMDNVWCKPNSTVGGQLLQNCYYSFIVHSCNPNYRQDVWLQCGRNPLTHVLDFKLEEEPAIGITKDPRIGRMKLRTTTNGLYDDVCGTDFNDTAATAACRTLGFDVTHAGKIVIESKVKTFNTAMMYKVICPVNNSGLEDCTYKLNPMKKWNAYCRSPLFLDCHERHPEKWKFRIVPDNNGKSPNIGRLEMQPDTHSDWGTVCSNMFNNYSALMMCKAAGLTDVASARAILNYSSDKGTTISKRIIYLTDVVCDENSTSLKDCTYVYYSKGIPQSSVCDDMTDVGIECYSAPRPPSGIFTAIVSDNADTFLTRLTVYMGISRSSIEVLSFDSNSHQVKFRFIDHDGGSDTPNPKALETMLLKQWKDSHSELMRDTGIRQMYGPDTVSGPKSSNDTKGSSDLPIVLGVILCAVVLVGLAVGGIMYKRRRAVEPEKSSCDYVINNALLSDVPMKDCDDFENTKILSDDLENTEIMSDDLENTEI